MPGLDLLKREGRNVCVIFVVSDTRPTDDMVEKAYDANNAGAGIAWREKGLVRWEKGLDLESMKEYVRDVPVPFVAHFRIPTCGGAIPSLCHPFTIDRKASTELSGSTKGYVLFHNGHWGDWKKTCLETALKVGAKLPSGKWSDTRGMAWTAGVYGLGFLEMIDEKAVAFGPTDLEVIPGLGWVQMNGFWASNRHWETKRYNQVYHASMCKDKTCTKVKVQGSEWCLDHKPPTKDGETAIEKAVKEMGPGGAPASATSPFAHYRKVEALFHAGQVGKRQLKKARKAMERAIWKGQKGHSSLTKH